MADAKGYKLSADLAKVDVDKIKGRFYANVVNSSFLHGEPNLLEQFLEELFHPSINIDSVYINSLNRRFGIFRIYRTVRAYSDD